MSYDIWKTTDPRDFEPPEPHGFDITCGCPECEARFEAIELEVEAMR